MASSRGVERCEGKSSASCVCAGKVGRCGVRGVNGRQGAVACCGWSSGDGGSVLVGVREVTSHYGWWLSSPQASRRLVNDVEDPLHVLHSSHLCATTGSSVPGLVPRVPRAADTKRMGTKAA